MLQANAWAVVIQKLNSGFLKRPLHPEQGAGLRVDGAVEGFHAAHRADGHARGAGKLRLIPPQ